jgi:hypothetical protein
VGVQMCRSDRRAVLWSSVWLTLGPLDDAVNAPSPPRARPPARGAPTERDTPPHVRAARAIARGARLQQGLQG